MAVLAPDLAAGSNDGRTALLFPRGLSRPRTAGGGLETQTGCAKQAVVISAHFLRLHHRSLQRFWAPVSFGVSESEALEAPVMPCCCNEH